MSTPHSTVTCHRCHKSVHPSRISYRYNPATGMHDVRVDGFFGNFSNRVSSNWFSGQPKWIKAKKDFVEGENGVNKILATAPLTRGEFLDSPTLYGHNLGGRITDLAWEYVIRRKLTDKKVQELKDVFENIRKRIKPGSNDSFLRDVKKKCNDFYHKVIEIYDPKIPVKVDLNDLEL